MSQPEQQRNAASKPPLGECPLTASHTRRACDNGGACWCVEHPEEVAAINNHPEVIEARSAANVPRPFESLSDDELDAVEGAINERPAAYDDAR